MALFDLYKKFKKKKEESFAPVKQRTSSGLGAMAQKFKNGIDAKIGDFSDRAFGNFNKSKMGVQKKASNFSDAIFKDSAPKWMQSVDSGLRNFSNKAENAPKFNFADKIKNPVGKFAASIPQEIMNIPSRTVSGAFKDYGKSKATPSYLIKRGAEAANIGLDIGSLFVGGNTGKNLVKEGFNQIGKKGFKETLKNGVKRGAKEGLAYGASSGALSGLQEGDSLKEQGKNAIKGAVKGGAMGAVAGGVLGGVSPAVGQEVKRTINDIKFVKNPYAKRIATKYDYSPVPGTFAPGGKPQMQPIASSERKVIETVKLPFQPKSILGKLTTAKPGLTIEDVSKKGPQVVSSVEVGQLKGLAQNARSSRNFEQFVNSLKSDKDLYSKALILKNKGVTLRDFYNQSIKTSIKDVSKKSKQNPNPENILKEQIGDIFTIQKPVYDLWKSKGNVIYIKPNRENAGFGSWLGGKNFIKSVQEAGNNVYKVTLKTPSKQFKVNQKFKNVVDIPKEDKLKKLQGINIEKKITPKNEVSKVLDDMMNSFGPEGPSATPDWIVKKNKMRADVARKIANQDARDAEHLSNGITAPQKQAQGSLLDKNKGNVSQSPFRSKWEDNFDNNGNLKNEMRAEEVIQKKINNRPYVKRTNTIDDIYDTYVKNSNENSKPLLEKTKDILEVTPEGKRSRLGMPNETNILNYSQQLKAIGYKKKQIDKIGFKEAEGIIDKFKAKYDPEYLNKKNEIGKFKKFVADFKQAEEVGIERGLQFLQKYSKLPREKAEEIIYHLDNPTNAPGDVAPFVKEIRNEFDTFFNEAQKAGLDVGYIKNYITHIWKEDPKEISKKIGKALKKGIIGPDDIASIEQGATKTPFFGFANSRMLKSYELGEKIGLHRKYTHPAQIIGHYAKQLERAKSVLRGINNFKESGEIVEGLQPGMKALTMQGAEGLSTNPKLADKLNNAFRDPSEEYYTNLGGKSLEKAAAVSRWLKETLMSGGIPATTVNSYGISMTLKEIGTLSPTRAANAVSSFVAANSPRASRKFFIENLDQIKKIKKHDINLSTMLDQGGFLDKGFLANIFGEKGSGIGGHWNALINEPTFQRYLPMNQVKFFNSIEKRLLKKGYSQVDAEAIAARELKEGMGLGSAAKQQARSQWSKDILETAFFAPTHRANMFRVFGNALKSFSRNPLKRGNRSATQFLTGGLAVYALYDWVNYKNTGQHLWDNPEGKKFESYIKIGNNGDLISIPFMPSVATMPRLGIKVGEKLFKGDLSGALGSAWQGSGSLLSKPLADVATNSDYFGRNISDEDDSVSKQWLDRAKYLGKSYTGHPWVKGGIDFASGKPNREVLAQMTEAPIRFSTEGKVASKKFWDTKERVKNVYEEFRALAKTNPEGANEFYYKNKEDIDSWPKINEISQMYSNLKGSDRETSDLKEFTFRDKFGDIVNDIGFGFGKNAQAKELENGDEMSSPMQKIMRGFEIEQKKVELANSTDNFMDLGDIVLRKSLDGTVKQTRKDTFTSQILQQKMEGQKRNENLSGWMKSAEEKFSLMEGMMNDSSLDELDKSTIQNDMESLMETYMKYKSYGGFTKPKKAKKAKDLDLDTSFIELKLMKEFGGSKKAAKAIFRPSTKGISTVSRKQRKIILRKK